MDNGNLNEREELCLTAFREASKLVDSIMSECGLDKKANPNLWSRIRKNFNKEFNKRIVFTALASIDSEYKKEFDNFYDSSIRINPRIDQDAVLLAFAMLYPSLREKIFVEMQSFADNFIKNYREVFES